MKKVHTLRAKAGVTAGLMSAEPSSPVPVPVPVTVTVTANGESDV